MRPQFPTQLFLPSTSHSRFFFLVNTAMSGQRCAKCALITTEFVLSKDGDRRSLEHHANFCSLEQSAVAGCDLCQLLCQSLLGKRSEVDTGGRITISVRDYEFFHTLCVALEFETGPRTMAEVRGWDNDQNVNYPNLSLQKVRGLSPESCERDVEELVTDFIRPWIDKCSLGVGAHKRCAGSKGGNRCRRRPLLPSLPTRVVDVGLDGQPPRLRERKPWVPKDKHDDRDPDCAQYILLSYCWGRSNESTKTTHANIEERTKSLDVGSLPKTIRDAIHLTRALGERYLWVDALCIVQSSDGQTGDWETESLRMGDYYGNALCTIAATGAQDNSKGCFLERPGRLFPVASCVLAPWMTGEGRTRTFHLHPKAPPMWVHAISYAPLYSRGWAMQERALSPRILHWAEDALYWECSELKSSEYYPLGLDLYRNHYDEIHMNVGSIMRHSRRVNLGSAWYNMIELYCGTNFTFPSDKLVALAGVAKRVNSLFPDQYAAGLWRDNLVEGLAWKTQTVGMARNTKVERPAIQIAPSWSWASVSVGVLFVAVRGSKWTWLASVLNVKMGSSAPITPPEQSTMLGLIWERWSDLLHWTHLRRLRHGNRVAENLYGSVPSGVIKIKGIVQDICFDVEPESGHPTSLHHHPKGMFSESADSTHRMFSTRHSVQLDASWDDTSPLSARTFRCLLLGRKYRGERRDMKEILGSLIPGKRSALVGYLVLEVAGDEAEQYYRRIGWAEVVEMDYDALLRTKRTTVQIV
ncbi:heterokaryon incompatibility protein-domain-containing protein [Lasiosphaeria ovina]|uniref:Heterokaryon incompatibility protein-domain-containing protein n=1 Tax=Lasiosphaeria ovina TaxID=92902 RepID=A0AAE0K0X6_9PEZI|nr:heterokaryon incompatibility protein-domain-containing protein [Lasiosphaeria ovina]